MRRHTVITTLFVLSLLGCCYRAPWVQGPGSFYADAELGFAPLWTADFRNFPEARVDWMAFAVHVALACGVILLIGFGQSLRRSRN
jgi:hypothetical protein